MTVQIVAEMSGNHNGSLDRAMELVNAAKQAGADAIKLQTYTPDTITVKGERDDLLLKDGPWKGRYLWDLYAEAATPWDWHKQLFQEAERLGMRYFSTPFDLTAIGFLENLGCRRFKVSSFDIINTPLLRRLGAERHEVILSTGMATDDDIENALYYLRECRVTLLHCISEYPAKTEIMRLRNILHLREFGTSVGLSDHSMSNTAAMAATAMGATLIEKHLCLKRSDGGPDSSFSLEPQEFSELVQSVRGLEAACAEPDVTPEHGNKRLRPSLWVIKDVKAGDRVTNENVAVRRPDCGMRPSDLDSVIFETFKQDVKAPAPLVEAML